MRIHINMYNCVYKNLHIHTFNNDLIYIVVRSVDRQNVSDIYVTSWTYYRYTLKI